MVLERLRLFLKEYSGECIGIAVSGGSDSMCMLHALNYLKANIIAIHVNHQTRPESEAEAEFVKKYCVANNIPYVILTPETSLSLSMPNFENEARNARYRLFKNFAQKKGIRVITTSHHANDVVETVFLKLFRGSTNLFIPDRRYLDRDKKISIIRPLVSVPKIKILDYITEYHVPHIEDSSNQNTKYLRNFIRHNLIPLLTKKNPKVVQHVINASCQRQEEAKFISEFVKLREKSIFPENECLINELLQENLFIQKNILQNKCCQFFNKPLTLKQLSNFLEIIHDVGIDFAYLYEDKEYKLIKEYEVIKFISQKNTEKLEKKDILIHNNIIPSIYGWNVSIAQNGGLSFKENDYIYVRSFSIDDKIPWGNGHKTVSQFLKDKKIPRDQRLSVGVIIKNDEIAGVLGSNFVYIIKKHQSLNQGLYFDKDVL